MERYDLPADQLANEQEAGALRIASETDEKNCGCNDAAVTPKNLYKLSNYRIANTAYEIGDSVAVPYHPHLMLTCFNAGSTAPGSLDTTNVAVGERITDGTVIWVVEEVGKVKSVNGKTGDVIVDLPLGFMYFSLEKEVPAGRLPASGAIYNRPLYQNLYNWADERGLVISESEWQAQASANDGYCNYYSSGNGSTTFRVPKLPNTLTADIADEFGVKGNGMGIGITNGTQYRGLIQRGNDYARLGLSSKYGLSVGTDVDGTASSFNGEPIVGITTDTTKSGIVAETSSNKITGQWLIVAFGVAHNIGEADVANVMQAVEQVQTGLNVVAGISDYIIESYRNGTEWYEVYKSGKVRQGGYTGSTSQQHDTKYTITLLKEMANTNYYVNFQVITDITTGTCVEYVHIPKSGRQTNKLTYQHGSTRGGTGEIYYTWEIEGQGA